MKVLWKSDMGQGKHDPLEIVSVVTKSGSSISADLVVPLDAHTGPVSLGLDNFAAENAGLLEVIDAQLAAIDEQAEQLKMCKAEASRLVDPDDAAKEAKDLKEWADQFPHLIEDLCMALGYARRPIAPTGIPELDVLVRLSE